MTMKTRSVPKNEESQIPGPYQKGRTMRYRSIDILRTGAVFEMVVTHFVQDLSGYERRFGVGGICLFLLLSGVSYHIWLASQKRQRKDPLAIRRSAVRRGMAFCVIGPAVYATLIGVEETVLCDTLVLLGLSQIFLASICWEMRSPTLVGICVAVIVCTPILRSIMAAEEYYVFKKKYLVLGLEDDDEADGEDDDTPFIEYYALEDRPVHTFTLTDVFKLHLVAGYFPLFPYVAHPILGLVIGRALIPTRTPSEDHQATRIPHQPTHVAILMSMAGAAMLAAGISLWLVWNAFPSLHSHMYLGEWRMFLPPFPCIIGTLGRALFLFGAAFYFIDGPTSRDNINGKHGKWSKRPLWRYLEPISNRYGKASLTIYCLHYAAIYWPMRIAGWLTDEDWDKEYLSYVFEPWQATIIGVLFFSLMYPLIGWADHHRIPRLEHAVRWLMS